MPASLLEVLGSKWPLIQAPMAGVQGSALAAAVCHAGGLGSLPCAMLSVEAKRAFTAMMTMKKIDVAAIEAARRG